MWEALQFEFMRQAVVASVLVGLLCGIVGTYVVVNRISFISGGIAHAAYGGVGISIFLGLPIFLGTGLFSLGIGLLIATISLKDRHRADTVIGVVWAMGMALGIIMLDLSPGYKGDILGYLFGNILLVSKADNVMLLLIDFFVVVFVARFFRELMAVSFDPDFSSVIGIPTGLLYKLLICLISISIVAVIKIVGLLLVVALLTIPPYISEKFVSSMGKMMVLSGILTVFFCMAGLQISYKFNLPPGGTIIMITGFFFFVSRFVK